MLRSKISGCSSGRITDSRTREMRCKEIIFTLQEKGHRVDPVQRVQLERLSMLRRMLLRRPDLRDLFVRAHALRQAQPRSCVTGPVGLAFETVKELG